MRRLFLALLVLEGAVSGLSAQPLPAPLTERTLLAACLADPDAIATAKREKAEELMETSAFQRLLAALYRNPKLNLAQFTAELEQADAEAISGLLREEGTVQDAARTAEDCIGRLRQQRGQAELARMQERLTDPGLTAAERAELLQKISMQIKAKK